MKNTDKPRRKHEEAPAAVSRRIYHILENIQDGIYVIDRDWRFIYVNRHSAEYLGVEKEELLGKNVWEKFPQLIGTKTEVMNRKAMEEREPQHYETRGILTDKWYSINVYPSEEGISIYWQDITERKAAEEKLRKSEEMFRLHFENVSDVIYSLDRNYRINSASPSVEKFLGYRPDEIIGKAFTDLNILAPEYTEQAFLDIERIFAGGQIPSSIYEFVARDGSRFFADVSGAPLRVDGRVTGIVSVAKDITERKRAEDSLKRYKDHLKALVEERTAELAEVNSTLKASEAKYRFLAEEMNDVVWTADLGMNVTYCSPSVEKVLGFTQEEFMGKNAGERMTPESYAKAASELAADLARDHDEGVDPDRSNRLELEFYGKDGSTMWTESEISAIRNAEGDVVGLHGLSRNITDRKKAEEELLRSEAKHRFLTEKMNDVVWTADLDLNCTYCSPSVEKVFGYTVEERIRQSVSEIMTPDSLARVLDLFAAEIERDKEDGVDPERIIKLELELYHKEGWTIWMECEISAIRNPAGEPVGMYGVARNISDRKKTEEELLESEAKYRFLTEEMNDIVWTMDKDMKTTYISPSSERVYGYPIEERMKHRLDQMLTPESYARAMSILAAEIERDRDEGVDPKRSVRLELEYYHRNGSTVWIECAVTAIRNAAGDLVGIHGVSRDITARRQAEDELKKHRDHLDELVRERTAELTKAYEQLERENAKRKATEESLRAREKELEKERREINEMNAALKVLLKQREKDKVNIREDIASNIKISVLPLLDKMGTAPLKRSHKAILETVKSRLDDIASPFVRKISSDYLRLTPNEIKVAYLIKEGKTSKEIAEFMNVSLNTINTHRYKIREKTGLRSKKTNLGAYLQTLE